MPVDHPVHLQPDPAPALHGRKISATLGFFGTLCCLWVLSTFFDLGAMMS